MTFPEGCARPLRLALCVAASAAACKAPRPAEPEATVIAPSAASATASSPASPPTMSSPEPDGPVAQVGPGPVAAALGRAPSAQVAEVTRAAPIAPPSASTQRALSNPTPSEPAAGAQPAQYLVAALGDSLTDPRSHGGGYLRFVKARCPKIEIDNFGVGGAMVTQMRRRFDAEVLPSRRSYTHLLVFGGVNDLYSDLTAHRTPAKIEADLAYIYQKAHARGMRVIAVTVAPWGGFTRYFNASRSQATHELNAWLRAQQAEGAVDVVIDAYALLSCGEPERLCSRFLYPFEDGLHFGRAGHELLGAALYRAAFADCQ